MFTGSDFEQTTQLVSFPPGVTKRTINVRSTEDTKDENDEMFSVVLRNQSADAQLGSDSRADVTIVDDDGKTLFSCPVLQLRNTLLYAEG